MKDDFYNKNKKTTPFVSKKKKNTTPWEVGNVHFDLSVAVAVTTRTILILLYELVVWVNSLSLSQENESVIY